MIGIILDIALITVIVFFITVAAKKGFIKASRNIAALILTAVLMTSLQPVVLGILRQSPLGDNIKIMVSKNITGAYEKEQLPPDADTTDTEQSLMICEALSLPSFLSDSIEDSIKQMSEIKNNVMEVITDSISLFILRLISIILLFLAVRIFVFLVLKLLESLFGLPVLKTVNKTLGAVIGIVNALIAVYIICGAVSLLTPTANLAEVQTAVDTTYILKYFYNNNLLLSLFI